MSALGEADREGGGGGERRTVPIEQNCIRISKRGCVREFREKS